MSKGLLCRSILYPKCSREGVFDDLALLQLVDVLGNKSVYALSLASRYLLRDEAGAHGYGVRTASRINDAYEARVGSPPPAEKKTFYLGFYDLQKNALKDVSPEHYRLTIRHFVEHDERAHFQLELEDRGLLGAGKANDRLRREDRNVAMMMVLSLLVGPRRRPDIQDGEPGPLEWFELPTLPRSATSTPEVLVDV
jgi:hypothetical protein